MSEERYWGNVLSSFEAGVQMDFRFKIALELLKGPMFSQTLLTAEQAAAYAINAADQLLSQAQARGLLKPLPEDDGLSSAMRRHLRRNVRAQAVQQNSGQEIAMEEAPRLSRVAPPPDPGRRQ